MITLTLAEVAAATGGRLTAGADPDAAITGSVVIDSRQAGPGDLFVALAGERVDGHDHAPGAVAAGAVAVLAARPVGEPAVPAVLVDDPQEALGRLAREVRDRCRDLVVVGVTGSSGKTSTKDLLAAVLAAAGPTVAPQGSFNNEIGAPLTTLRVDAGTRFLVVEMGARGPGHIAYLCSIARPDIGVVLNVGSAHAGEFGGREATARAKGELVEALAADGLAVLNADDRLVTAMAGRTRARVVRTGLGPDADVRAENVELDAEARPSFDLVTPAGTARVHLALHGAHHVANALATAAVALECGLGPDAIASALSSARAASRWRMEVRESAEGLVVVNDAYNANPESVTAALAATAAMAAGRGTSGWAVLGEMLELGDESAAEHRAVGRRAAELAGEGASGGLAGVIAVGPGAAPVAEGARAAAGPGFRVLTARDGDDAAAQVEQNVGRGDVVLVKASRSIGLERLADRLLRPGAGPARGRQSE
jgi:UDP-N-acetylmuramoyl-tripeptide--D-alanyl-D-alanine ligase